MQQANHIIFIQATTLRAKEDAIAVYQAEKKKGKEKADTVAKLELSESDSDDNMKNVPPAGYKHRTTVTIGERKPVRSPRAELQRPIHRQRTTPPAHSGVQNRPSTSSTIDTPQDPSFSTPCPSYPFPTAQRHPICPRPGSSQRYGNGCTTSFGTP